MKSPSSTGWRLLRLLPLMVMAPPFFVVALTDSSSSSSFTSSRRSTAGSVVDIEHLLDELGWEGQIGQMAQIDINMLLTPDKGSLNQTLLDRYIGELGIGSVLNNIATDDYSKIWSIAEFRQAVIQIQATAQKYKRPPVIWGLDSVHGANYLHDTITTPQPINLAASFNDTLAYLAGKWASYDTRRAGIPWLFSPLLGLSWDSFWSRTYETFGEDPLLVGDMALAMIQGIQAPDKEKRNGGDYLTPSHAAACAKHWVGYSFPHTGHDRAPSWIPKRHLYQYFLLPWKKVLQQSPILTVMESYTEIDGVPNVANRQTLSRILRQELKFQGMLVTDYHEIFNLFEWHHTASSRDDALLQSITEGSVDMSMIANEPIDFMEGMKTKLRSDVFRKRIRTSARRVLELKQGLHMFEESFELKPLEHRVEKNDKEKNNDAKSQIPLKDLQEALEMTQQSIILAKNDQHTLPLDPRAPLKILVTGPTSRSLSFQTGGWTGQWQGINSNYEDEWFTYGSTVVGALQRETTSTSPNWQVSYVCGVDILGNDCESEPDGNWADKHGDGLVDTVEGWVGWKDEHFVGIESAVKQAQDADVIVVCLGEENYTEKPGDIRDLNLPTGQYELVAGLREAAPEKKIILVYFGGRPRLLADVAPSVDAVFLGFLPGPLAGDALVDLMTGRANPSARLPITYPKFQDLGGVPYLHAVSDMCTKDTGVLPHWENEQCDIQWSFGHGLSYTRFDYSDLRLNTKSLRQHWGTKDHKAGLIITVTVTNSGSLAGAETVLLFSFDEFRLTTPEYKRLRGYQKVWLGPGESTIVTFKISLLDLRFVGPHDETHYILEDDMVFRVGIGSEVDCRKSLDNELCSDPVTIRTETDYVAACETACALWRDSGCSNLLSQDSCRKSCTTIREEEGTQLNNDGWGWPYVTCLENLLWEQALDSSKDCWKMTSFCRDVVNTPRMDEFGSGQDSVRFAPIGIPLLAVGLSLFAGVFASAMIYLAMHGQFSPRNESDNSIQFAAISTMEVA